VSSLPYAGVMTMGALGVVEDWLAAINAGDGQHLREVTAEDVEIVGPRGSAHGRQVLGDWLDRAGFSADALRWFCGSDGAVVVEQDASWTEASSGTALGRARVASQFIVRAGRVGRYQRHDSLPAALACAGLSIDDEVRHRQG
jgi:hypothetical protein